MTESVRPSARPRVLITGAAGYLGRRLLHRLSARGWTDDGSLVAMDVHPAKGPPGVRWITKDIREPDLDHLLAEHRIQCVVHLAAVVNPERHQDRAFAYSVDVEGTENLLEACIAQGVQRLVVTSSGAAYGYHPDNPHG